MDRESYSLAAGLALGLIMFGVRVVHFYVCFHHFSELSFFDALFHQFIILV